MVSAAAIRGPDSLRYRGPKRICDERDSAPGPESRRRATGSLPSTSARDRTLPLCRKAASRLGLRLLHTKQAAQCGYALSLGYRLQGVAQVDEWAVLALPLLLL